MSLIKELYLSEHCYVNMKCKLML